MSATSDPIPILPSEEEGGDDTDSGSDESAYSAYYPQGRTYRPANTTGVVQFAQFRSSPRDDGAVADVVECCERATVTRRKGEWLYADGWGWFQKDGWVYDDGACSSKASAASSSHGGMSSLSPSPTVGVLHGGHGGQAAHAAPGTPQATSSSGGGGGVGFDQHAHAHPHPQGGASSSNAVAVPRPRAGVDAPLSSSLPQRGSFAGRSRSRSSSVASVASAAHGVVPPAAAAAAGVDVVARSPTLAAALDLVGGAGPTLKSSIPVQMGVAKSQKKRRHGHDDAVDHDCLWLLGGAPQDAPPRQVVTMPKTPSLKQVILEEGPPVTMATLLLAWTAASAGILSISLVHEKGRIWAEDGEHVVELTLFTTWVETICASFLFAVTLCAVAVTELCNWREVHRRSQAVACTPHHHHQHQHQLFHVPSNQPTRYSIQYQWSLFRSLRGCGLLVATVVLCGLATTAAIVASEYTPNDVSLFFISAHPSLVLIVRAMVGGSSTVIEKIGAAMIMIGTGCFGLSNYILPRDQRVTHLHFLSRHQLGFEPVYNMTWAGVGLAVAAGMCYAACFIGAKHIRLQKKNLQMPLPAFALCCSVASLVVLTATAILLASEDGVKFNQDDTHGVFGWTNPGVAKEIALLGCTKGLGLLGFFGALKNLPTPIMAAIFSLQPALIFLAQLALRDTDDDAVPIFTQPVGVLCVLGGCICVCRASIYRVTLIDPTAVSQDGGVYSAGYGDAACSGCQTRGAACPVHGIEGLGLGGSPSYMSGDSARLPRLSSYVESMPGSSRRARRGSSTVVQSPYARQQVTMVPHVSGFPVRSLQTPYVHEEEPTPRHG